MKWRAMLTCALGVGHAGCALVVGFDEITGEPLSGMSTGMGTATGGYGGSGTVQSTGGASSAGSGGAPSTGTGGAPSTGTGGVPSTGSGSVPGLVLAKGEVGVESLAVDQQFVYWVNGSKKELRTTGINGPTLPRKLASADSKAIDLVIDAEHAYWSDNSGLKAASINMSSSNTFEFSEAGGAKELTSDADFVYWTNVDSPGTIGAIKKMNKKSQAVSTVVDQVSALDVEVDAEYIYWSDTTAGADKGAIKRAPIGGAAITILADGLPLPNRIAIDSKYVYWTDIGKRSINVAAKNNDTGNPKTPLHIQSLPIANMPFRIVVDEKFIYWTTLGAGGGVWKASKGALFPHPPVIPVFSSDMPASGGLAVDANNVYATMEDGTIRQVHK